MMSTLADIAAHYTVVDGRIVSPGKFEGEPAYTVVLWDMVQEGRADDSCGSSALMWVDEDMIEAWPALASVVGLILWESECGFVRAVEYADMGACERDWASVVEDDAGEDGGGQ